MKIKKVEIDDLYIIDDSSNNDIWLFGNNCFGLICGGICFGVICYY